MRIDPARKRPNLILYSHLQTCWRAPRKYRWLMFSSSTHPKCHTQPRCQFCCLIATLKSQQHLNSACSNRRCKSPKNHLPRNWFPSFVQHLCIFPWHLAGMRACDCSASAACLIQRGRLSDKIPNMSPGLVWTGLCLMGWSKSRTNVGFLS